MKKIITVVILALLLSMMIPGYCAEVNIEETPETSNETAMLTLEDIISIAKENSSEIETARMKIYKAELDTGEKKDDYDNYNNIFSSGMSVQAQVTKIMTGKGYYYDLAVMSLENIRRDSEFVMREIEIDAMNIYYDVLYRKDSLSLKEDALNTAESKYNEVKLKYELGKAANLDLKTAENNYLDAEMNKANAQKDMEYAIQKLNVFLGYEYNNKTDITGDLSSEKFSTEMSFNEMYDNAVHNSRNYQSAYYNFEKARLLYELVDGAMAATNVGKEAYADFIVAKNSLEKTKNDIIISVLGDLIEIEKLEKSIDSYIRNKELQKDKVKLKQTEYGLGLATLTDVFEEESKLRQAELNLLNAKKNYCITVREFENTIAE